MSMCVIVYPSLIVFDPFNDFMKPGMDVMLLEVKTPL